MLVYYITHPFIGLPIVLLLLILIRGISKFNSILTIIFVVLYIYIGYKTVSWVDYGSFYLKYIVPLLLIVCGIISIKKTNRLTKTLSFKWIINTITTFKLFGLAILLLIFSYMVFTKPGQKPTIDLSFPLKNGTFYVSNYHDQWTEEYAYDIVKLNVWGRMWSNSLFKPERLELYNIFKDTIYSPCNGKIKEAVDHYQDHETGELKDFKVPTNKIIIDVGDKSVELLHLLQNSALVDVNDSVSVGQPLALVGNSGRSKLPHLHINVYRNYYDMSVQSSPAALFSFNGKILSINGLYNN